MRREIVLFVTYKNNKMAAYVDETLNNLHCNTDNVIINLYVLVVIILSLAGRKYLYEV